MFNRLLIASMVLSFGWGCETAETAPTQDLADAAPMEDMDLPDPIDDMGVDAMPMTEIDMAVPMSTACDEGEVIDFASMAMADADGVSRIMAAHTMANNFVGSCGGEGYDAVIRFTAPAAGLWSFLVAGTDDVMDTVMYARTDCVDFESEFFPILLSLSSKCL